jgi:serine protease Do
VIFGNAAMIFKILVLLLIPSICFSHSLHRVFEKVNSTVVVIHTKYSKLQKQSSLNNKQPIKKNIGSGVVISEDGKIMTASHLIHSADMIQVEFLNGDVSPCSCAFICSSC